MTTRRIVTILEIVTIDPFGIQDSIYFTTIPYRTPPYDTGFLIIEEHFDARIINDLEFDFRVGVFAQGQATSTANGYIDLTNIDRGLDYLLDNSSKGLPAYLWMGYDDEEFFPTGANFEKVAYMIQDGFEMATERVVRCFFTNSMKKLEEPFPMVKHPETIPNVNNRGASVPKVYGKTGAVAVQLYDKPNEIYATSDLAALTNIVGVYDNGINLPEDVTPPPAASQFSQGTTAEGLSMIQLGSNSAGTITAFLNTLDARYVNQLPNKLLEEYGLDTLINTDDLQYIRDRKSWTIGLYVDQAIAGIELVQQVLDTFNMWMYQDENGEIRFGLMRDPHKDAVFFVNEDVGYNDFIKTRDKGEGLTARASGYKNYFVFEDDALAAGTLDADRQRLTKEWPLTETTTNFFHPDYSFAEDAEPLPSLMGNSGPNVKRAVEFSMCWYGMRRWYYQVTTEMDEIAVAKLRAGDIIALREEDFGITDPYDFNNYDLTDPAPTSGCFCYHGIEISAGPGDTATGYVVSHNRSQIDFSGNHWKLFEYPYTVTEDTLLEFDIYIGEGAKGAAPKIGEIIGIGLTNDGSYIASQCLQLYGTQTYGDQTYAGVYTTTNQWQRISIPVGKVAAFVGQTWGYIWLIMDYDAYNGTTNVQDVRWRNIRMREKGYHNTVLVGAKKRYGSRKITLLTWGA